MANLAEESKKYANETTVAKAPSELERLDRSLDRQTELLMFLAERLRPVTHNVPQEAGSSNQLSDRAIHISAQVDRVENHNQALQYILDTLAV